MQNILFYFSGILTPFILFAILHFIQKKRDKRLYRRNFWHRQNIDFLRSSGLSEQQPVIANLDLLERSEAYRTVMQVTALCQRMGVFEQLAAADAESLEPLITDKIFTSLQIRAAEELLQAAGIIIKKDDKIGLTPEARLYLVRKSPLFRPLALPAMTRHYLKLLKKGTIRRSLDKWRKGKTSLAHNWASNQHLNSFKLGFALYNSGLINAGATFLDVAGGAGSVCIALALKQTDLTLKMIELPGSIPVAKKMIAHYGVTDRIECLGMDMFNGTWPGDCDFIGFTNIFHDWDDVHCRILLNKSRQALRPGGKIIIQEALLNDDSPGPLWTAHWSMAMALFMEGRQFRFTELEKLLMDNGFRKPQRYPLCGYYSSIVAERA